MSNIGSRKNKRKFTPFTFLLFCYMFIFLRDKVANLKGSFIDTFIVGTFDKLFIDLEVVESIETMFF